MLTILFEICPNFYQISDASKEQMINVAILSATAIPVVTLFHADADCCIKMPFSLPWHQFNELSDSSPGDQLDLISLLYLRIFPLIIHNFSLQ